MVPLIKNRKGGINQIDEGGGRGGERFPCGGEIQGRLRTQEPWESWSGGRA